MMPCLSRGISNLTLWKVAPCIELIHTFTEEVMHLDLHEEQIVVLMSKKSRHQTKQEETLLPLFAVQKQTANIHAEPSPANQQCLTEEFACQGCGNVFPISLGQDFPKGTGTVGHSNHVSLLRTFSSVRNNDKMYAFQIIMRVVPAESIAYLRIVFGTAVNSFPPKPNNHRLNIKPRL